VARWGASVQHIRPAGGRVDSARLFLCARCDVQVVLCSRCDRGNRYCGRTCSQLARQAARREAASRYQRSRRGRAAHARRMRCCRQRTAARAKHDANAAESQNVTHQGCPPPGHAAPLVAWTHDSTIVNAAGTAGSITAPEPGTPTAAPLHCRRCAALLPGWLRQGFVRHAVRPATAATPRAGRRHDHFP